LELENGSCHVEEEICMGCGVCVGKCPEGAISLRLEPARGKPLEIFDLIAEARGVLNNPF
jgi:Fe-S-cluster-containing hydrogenase component 2